MCLCFLCFSSSENDRINHNHAVTALVVIFKTVIRGICIFLRVMCSIIKLFWIERVIHIYVRNTWKQTPILNIPDHKIIISVNLIFELFVEETYFSLCFIYLTNRNYAGFKWIRWTSEFYMIFHNVVKNNCR